jgi:DNA polymerase
VELYLDTETYNDVPISHGAHKYAETAEVVLVAFAWNDEPVIVWDTQDRPHWRAELQELVNRADRVIIHNSAFDRTVLRHQGVTIPTEKIEDTMVLALAHSLPPKLEQLCEALRLPVDKAKDKDGKRLIQLFTKPRPKNAKIRRATRETHREDWQRFISYAARDVDAMRDVRRLLPRWNASEGENVLWRIDQVINDRGVCVDLELADAAVRAFARTLRSLADDTARLTGGAVTSLTQRDKFLEYLRSRGVDIPDLTKATVARLLEADLPSDILRLLQIRQQASATSPAKYGALRAAASSDGRLRGAIQFCGAGRTGRDAGRIFQPQNLPRTPDWFDERAQETTIESLKADCEHLIYENVSERCAFAVRGALIAAPGHKLLIADLSNIEGRVLAWLADEQWKIEAFKAYDRGEGPDLYKVTAGRILGKDSNDITKEERQLQGKVPELAGGYGGGVGAYRRMGGKIFDTMSDREIEEIVQAWRAAHPAIKKFWYDVEGIVRCAIRDPDYSYSVREMVTADYKHGPDGIGYVRLRLPSGRYLCYRNMRIDEDSGQLLYDGLNQYTRKWGTLDTYYGKLAENIVQAVARDVFMSGMLRAELSGYPVVLRVHDELVCEVPDDPVYSHEKLAEFMAVNPSWSTGLPLSAAGFEAYRYRKE